MESTISKYYWIYTITIFIITTFIFYLLFGGVLFGAGFNLVIFFYMLIVGFIIGLISAYVIGPLILWSSFKKFDDLMIEGIIQELSKIAGIKRVPKLMIFNSPEYNALVYESIFGPRLAITSGLINGFYSGNVTEDELKAIIGHELGHIKHGDTLRRWIVQSWISIFHSIGSFLLFTGFILAGISAVEAVLERNTANILVGLILSAIGGMMMLISKLVGLIALHHDRFNEYLADEFGARLVGGNSMISALIKINQTNSGILPKGIPYSPYPDSWQVKPVKTNPIENLFSDHPPIEKRIERIKKIGIQ